PAATAAVPAAAATVASTTAATAAAEAPPAATAAAAAGTTRALARLVDFQGTAVELVAVERLDRRLRILIGTHLDDTESARAAGLGVGQDRDALDRASALGERRTQGVLGRGEVEIADVELGAHRGIAFSRLSRWLVPVTCRESAGPST